MKTMIGTKEYMHGFIQGQNNSLSSFQDTATIINLNNRNNQLARENQRLKNKINALTNNEQSLINALSDMTAKHQDLKDRIRNKKEIIDRISFLSGHYILYKKEFTDDEYERKKTYLIELINLVYGLRKFFMGKVS